MMRHIRSFVVPICTTLAVVSFEGCETRPGYQSKSTMIGNAEFEVGAADELMLPTAATFFGNGEIAIADAHAHQILLVDSMGRFLRAVGKKGSGPGEFQVPSWISACTPDSLFVYDPMLRRVTVFNPDGAPVRLFSWRPAPTWMSCGSGIVAITAPDPGTLTPPIAFRSAEPVAGSLFFGKAGNSVPKQIGDVTIAQSGALAQMAQAAVGRTRIYYGDGFNNRIDVYNRNGEKIRSFKLPVTPRSPSKTHVAAHIERQLQVFSDKMTKDQNREVLKRLPVHGNLPAYSRIIADNRDRLWAVTSFPGDSGTTILIVNERGTVELSLESKLAMEILAVDTTRFVGSYQKDGQPRVGVFRLR